MEPTDAELLTRIRDADSQACEIFAHRHAGAMRDYAISCGASDADAKDVTQQLLLVMISRPPSVLKNTSAGPYMNQAIRRDVVRAKRPREAPLSCVVSSLADDGTSPSAAAARDELLRAVQQQVRNLATPEREVLRLRFQEELSFAEISAVTGRPLATERSTLSRAIKKLRQVFDFLCNETATGSSDSSEGKAPSWAIAEPSLGTP
jgi:RNA polymerase sigma factor (sigma-70 family)